MSARNKRQAAITHPLRRLLKRSIALALFLLLSMITLTAQKAEAILEKAAKTYEASNGITASLTINIRHEKQAIAESFEGEMEMRGERFLMKSPSNTLWYDGKTLWSYVKQTDEVNISTPTGEDLQMLNPMLLLRNYKSDFKCSYVGESTTANTTMADDLLLTAKKKQEIKEIALQMDRTTRLPARIAVTMSDGLKSTIHIRQIKSGMQQPDERFTFQPDDYPNVLEIDLR